MTPDELIRLRKHLDLTQGGLGELIGLGLRAYQDLEGGKSPIRALHVLALERTAEKLAVAAKDPMMAPAAVRRDALDLTALILDEAAAHASNSESTMSRKLGVDRNLRQQIHQKLLETVPNFGLYLLAQDEEARMWLLTSLRQIPNFRQWEKLGKQIVRTEQHIASGHGTSNWYGPMEKEKKTARELADMIMAKINIGGVHVAVHPDPVYGWHPTVVTAPSQAVKCQEVAEEIAKELRTKFNLKV